MSRITSVVLLSVLFAAALPVMGQTSRGTVSGIVTDPSGASVQAAEVTLTNTATNLARSTTTNESGLYRFDAVDPGQYDLSIRQTGFNVAHLSGFTVQAAQVTSHDVRL